MGLTIHVLCNSDGSSSGVCESTIDGDTFRVGVGGSELALLTMCRIWHDDGHKVILYNNPWRQDGSVFEQRPTASYSPNEARDFLVVFRSPDARAVPSKGRKIWWSCDQYTVGDYRNFSDFVDKIVCISPFHARYFEEIYGITKTIVIDLPVRLSEFEAKTEKIKNRLVFTSVPDRGLQNLWRIYPKIKQYIPDLSVAITSDYRLWGAGELNGQHRSKWILHDDVEFLGALPRSRYTEELMKADLMLYPANYDECFCYSVAEAQVAGVPVISSARGALATTNMGHIFYVDANDQRNDFAFIDRTVEVLSNRVELDLSRDLIMQMARERFSPERIKQHWNKHIFEDNEE